jgi:hypothetical protein
MADVCASPSAWLTGLPDQYYGQRYSLTSRPLMSDARYSVICPASDGAEGQNSLARPQDPPLGFCTG